MRTRTLARVNMTPNEGDDVITVLLEDHARTRSMLRRAWRLAHESGPAHAVANVASEMREFFRYWNPLHEVDEEQSVAPALLVYARDQETQRVVSEIVSVHQVLDRERDAVARVWDALAENPHDIDYVREDLRHGTKALLRELSKHAAWEEREFFPRVRLYVPASVQTQILAVMRARRGQASRAA